MSEFTRTSESTKPVKPRGERRCRICRKTFSPRNALQAVCGSLCAAEHARRFRVKRERAELRNGRTRLKTKSQWLKDAQAAMNAWARARDVGLPCISCGRHAKVYDAGHYRSTAAAPALRFDPDNVHAQCVPCNQHKSGNAIEYRLGLIARIGLERVERLEQDPQPAKWSIEEIKAIRDDYRARTKALRKELSAR